jgi:hypothetical protein
VYMRAYSLFVSIDQTKGQVLGRLVLVGRR